MDLDSSFRDDYPFISSLFYDNIFKSDLGNEFSSLENPSSTGILFHRYHNNHDYGLISESTFSNPHHLNRFTIEGSSKSPFLGISTMSFDPLEGYSNGFLGTEGAYTPTPLVPNSTNEVLYGPKRRGFLDYSQHFSAHPKPETPNF